MFTHTLTKTLTAGVLSLTLIMTSLTPSTASAQISDEEAVVGLFTLLLLGAAINNRNNRDTTDHVTQPRSDWRVLPSQCLRQIETRRGDTVRLFGQRCLNNNYAHVNRLPQDCHARVRTANGERRQGFRARCLRNAGFRTGRH